MLKNLGEYLERLLLKHHSVWRKKISELILLSDKVSSGEVRANEFTSDSKEAAAGILRPEVAARYQARSVVYRQVFRLLEQSVPIEQIAQSIGKSTRTVFRWSKQGECHPRTRNRKSGLDQYWGFIKDWQVNRHNNVIHLCKELQKMGYRGSSMAVRRYLERKQLLPTNKRTPITRSKIAGEKLAQPMIPLISPRAAVLKLLHYDKLKAEEKPLVDQILKSSPEIEAAVELGREFESLIMGRDKTAFEGWLNKAQTSSITDIKSFARGLAQDKSAVQAAVKYKWSQGQVEGQVNRLKLIKRQMYGRANFDLLKARVIYQA